MSGSDSAQRGETSWRVKEPDEAKYNFSDEKGVWQPKPEDILSLFEKLSQGKPLPLKWTCPGRRPPEKNAKSNKYSGDRIDMDDDDSKEEESRAPEASAFDFDEPYIDVNAKLIPKRAPGGLGRTPKTEKRVARMDNIMKSLHKQQLQRAAEREARKAKGSPSSTPPGRSRLLNFGSEGSKNLTTDTHSKAATSPRFAGSSSASGSSPLPNRGSAFMTLNTATRKNILKPNINDATAQAALSDTRGSEVSNLQASASISAPMGSSLTSAENRLEQVNTTRDLAESVGPMDDISSATVQLAITSTATAALVSTAANNSTKPNTSSSYTSSVSISKDMTSNLISNSPIMSLDKEFVHSDSVFPDTSQQFMSSSTRAVTSTTSVVNTTSSSEIHHVPSVPTSTSSLNNNDSGMNLENVFSDASVQNHPTNLTESVTLSVNNGNPDVQNSGNTN